MTLMAISLRANRVFSRLQTLIFKLQRSNHSLVEEGGSKARFYGDIGLESVAEKSAVDISTWKKVDSRIYGISRSMISSPSWIVLKILQSEGFEAYLVGGCVRDLLLNKTPKDYDVITTAGLKQIREQFHRSEIVGRRFPICRVHVKGSVIEVSSFETVAEHAKEKETILFSQIPTGCDVKDFVRWRNCMHRDFTVNSLFYDPFLNKIYDYANGMVDLSSLKLRTVIPAQLSFREDHARILRGLRIAARLGLSFSKETDKAMQNLSSSIMNLDKSRLMMELNFMLSYGASESSLHLLRRFNLLEILLPIHAAHLAQKASNQSAQRSDLLMKLFFNVDKLLACDRPCHCGLWVGLLAFHLALVNVPQDALVIWTFSSVLYHGNWTEAVKFARENSQMLVQFVPEISEVHVPKSDEALAKEVTHLASLVKSSIDALTEIESLHESMARYPLYSRAGLVFIPKKTGQNVAELFNVLVTEIESYSRRRQSFEIDYKLLGKGDHDETRFVLGRVIMDTMRSGIVREQLREVVEKEKCHLPDSDLKQQWMMVKGKEKHRQKAIQEKKLGPPLSNIVQFHQEAMKENKKRHLSLSNLQQQEVKKQQNVVVKKKCDLSQTDTTKKQQKVLGKKCYNLPQQEIVKNQQKVFEKKKCHLPQSNLEGKQEVVKEKNEKQEQELVVVEKRRLPLSSLFM